jgi:hypothetical protein
VTSPIRNRALKIFAFIVAVYGAILAAVTYVPSLSDSVLALLAVAPYLTVAAFSMIGIPGVLLNDGACGWGWCPPTIWGWTLSATFWLALAWLISLGLAKLTVK